MSGIGIKMVLVAVLAILLLIIAPLLKPAHWWKKIGGAAVTYDGHNRVDSSVYRSDEGNLLVLVRGENNNGASYIIFPETLKVGLSNRNKFFALGPYVYCRDNPPPVVLMDSPKADLKPELVIQPGYVEFTTTKNARVRVTL